MAIAPRSVGEQTRIDNEDEAIGHAKFLSMADYQNIKKSTPPCPTNMSEFTSLLKVYTTLLRELFGPRNPHYKELEKLRSALKQWFTKYKDVDYTTVAALTWTIIDDARSYFHSISDENDLVEGIYPSSSLSLMRMMFLQTATYRNGTMPHQWNRYTGGQFNETGINNNRTYTTQQTQRQ